MSHDLFNERFYSNREIPWHGLGYISDENHTAREALGFAGEFYVGDYPLTTTVDGVTLELDQRVILRHPTQDDNEWRVFGVVGPEYQLVTPQTLCDVWDTVVTKPVETLGALNKGRIFFISTKLEPFDIGKGGDTVENYLLVTSPMMAGVSLDVRTTPVRVVCKNTLMAAAQDSTSHYQISHNKQIWDRLSAWLSEIQGVAELHRTILKGTFESFSRRSLVDDEIQSIIDQVYPVPQQPEKNAPEAVMTKRLTWWEYYVRFTSQRRLAVREGFDGKATGADVPGFQGTAWGLYNTICEIEDFSGRIKGDSRATNVLLGIRGKRQMVAYDLLTGLISKGSVPQDIVGPIEVAEPDSEESLIMVPVQAPPTTKKRR